MTEKESSAALLTGKIASAAVEQPSGKPVDGSEQKSVPKCCASCSYYKPKVTVANIWGRECAAFGSIAGVRKNRCGLWSPR